LLVRFWETPEELYELVLAELSAMAYESPAALRQALETRLGSRSRETGVDLERLRRRAAFERLLVRLELGAPRSTCCTTNRITGRGVPLAAE
jgi:hypothetical protein